MAAERIVRGFETYLKIGSNRLAGLPVEIVQTTARSLFTENSEEMAAKYR